MVLREVEAPDHRQKYEDTLMTHYANLLILNLACQLSALYWGTWERSNKIN